MIGIAGGVFRKHTLTECDPIFFAYSSIARGIVVESAT